MDSDLGRCPDDQELDITGIDQNSASISLGRYAIVFQPDSFAIINYI